MNDEQKVDGISARIAKRADNDLKHELSQSLRDVRNRLPWGMTVKIPRNMFGEGDEKNAELEVFRFLDCLEPALFEALRDGYRKAAYKAFLTKFDELNASVEEIHNREE